MTVDAEIAIVALEDGLAPTQVFFEADLSGFADFSASATHKTRERHSPVRVNLLEKETVQREVENPAHNPVPEIGFGNAVTVMEINALARDFKDQAPVDLHPERLRKKIPVGKVVVPAQDVHLAARLDKFTEREEEFHVVLVHVVAVLVPELEQVAHDNQVRRPALDGGEEVHEHFLAVGQRSRRVYPQVGIGYVAGTGFHHEMNIVIGSS